tara:strand:+ start:8572 stop:10842 length:2271 start_codon:yes stop_codon:yes gene_type:complete
MWETILKRNIKPNATLNEIEIKIRQALKVPALEDAISVNEDKAQRLVNTSKRKERQELLEIIKRDKETLKSYKASNPFVDFGNKKNIQTNDAGQIIDDGYGKGKFYEKAAPLTLQEAAEHYKETVVDYDKVKVNRVMPEDKPYSGSYGSKAKEPKPESSKEFQDLKEAENRLSYYKNIIEDKRTPSDKTMIVRLRREIKELEQEIVEVAQEESRVEFEAEQQSLSTVKNLPQIRTILQPISTADFNDFVISLDNYIDTGSAPIIDKYKEENPEKFAEIMDLVETSSTTTSVDEDRYLDKLLMMVNNKSIDFNRSTSNNRVSLQVTEKDGYRKEPNRLILPVNEDLSNAFGDISQWLAKHYEPVPEVKDKNLFIQKLVRGINETVDDKGGNNSIAYAIQHMINNNLADRFSNQIVVTGTYLDANTEQQKFREFIGTQARRNMKLLENVATFLHRGKQMSSFLTEDQMNQANEMLQEQVGSKAFGRYFLAEIPSAQLQKKPKSGLATRLGATGRKKIPRKVPEKPRSAKEVAETYESLREQQNYEPAPRGLTENQKEVLADIRQSYKINKPPSKKEVEERLQNLRQLQSETETVSDEEREILNQEFAEQLGPVAMKRDGIISYEPYSARRRKFSIGDKTLERVIAEIKTNLDEGSSPLSSFYGTQVKKADLSGLSTKERRKVKTMLQNAHPTEYFGEDYLRLGKVINIIDGLAEDEEAELLEKLGVKNLQMVKTAASLRKKYENLYKKLYDMVYDEEE